MVGVTAKRAASFLGGPLALGALLFGAAGTLAWVRGWAWLALMGIGFAVHDVLVERHSPGLLGRRRRIGSETPPADLVLVGLAAAAFLAIVLVAGLEERRGADALPVEIAVLGTFLHATGLAMVTWSMIANRFFETTVRLQEEEGHLVVDSGPYAFVRHPGYVGFSLVALAIPAVLGSLHAFLPAVLMVGALAVRTLLEERFLHAHLPGYADYVRRVRARWIPRVW